MDFYSKLFAIQLGYFCSCMNQVKSLLSYVLMPATVISTSCGQLGVHNPISPMDTEVFCPEAEKAKK